MTFLKNTSLGRQLNLLFGLSRCTQALSEEWSKKEEQEVREQLARRRKEAEALCRQFLKGHKRQGHASNKDEDEVRT